jgi:hypothetical protein
MKFADLDEEGQDFLLNVYRRTKGDPAAIVSMYDIGNGLGLDRADTSRLTENLMGWLMLEIRTLAGDIGITPAAVAEIEASGLANGKAQETAPRLGADPLISEAVGRSVVDVLNTVKRKVGGIGLAFDALSELMADLKTATAQLESPRPKTAIVRECFRSIKNTLETAGDRDCSALVADLLGE